MKWKYTNQQELGEGDEESTAAIEALLAGKMNVGGGGGGGAVRAIENEVYFYGDVSESNALELNQLLTYVLTLMVVHSLQA